MNELRISNIDYDDSRSVINKWYVDLNNVGCKIYAAYNKMILEWEDSTPDTTTHIIKFIDDTFGAVVGFSKLNRTLKNLEDDHVIIIDFNSGELEIKEL